MVLEVKKSPPILSHDFIIQNHGDIISCVIMVIMLGLMFQMTSSFAQIFIVPQHNVTMPATNDLPDMKLYTSGPKDLAALFFYTLVMIALHCAIQEYVFDKISKKLHLSRTKQVKFNESGQLFVWAAISAAHSGTILHALGIHRGGDIALLWTDYPEAHRHFSLSTKLFFIFQVAYWLHQFPEFYLQKLKRPEIFSRLLYIILFLISSAFFYISNFNRLGLLLLFLEFFSQTVFHFCRLVYFSNKADSNVFRPWNIMFPMIKLAEIVVTVLALWYGFRTHAPQTPYVNLKTGNWNTDWIRINLLLLVVLVQSYALFTFVSFHMSRMRELRRSQAANSISGMKKSKGVGQSAGKKKQQKQSENSNKKHN